MKTKYYYLKVGLIFALTIFINSTVTGAKHHEKLEALAIYNEEGYTLGELGQENNSPNYLSDNSNCDQGDDSEESQNGANLTNGFAAADDFLVASGTSFQIAQIELPIQMLSGTELLSIGLNFYENENGIPGQLILSENDISYTIVPLGSFSNFIEYKVFLNVDYTFTATSSSDRHIWFEPIIEINGFGAFFWEITSAGTLGDPYAYKVPGSSWMADEGNLNTVFKLYCEPVIPPDEVCIINFTEISPITRVSIGNIDNPTLASSNLPLQDFTEIIGYLEPGESYTISLEGNTLGNFENFFSVFIDWDQDGEFNGQDEIYNIGSITNSDGMDGIETTSVIQVPSGVALGTIKMRVIKSAGGFPVNACFGYYSGQAEDYSLKIGVIDDCDGTPEAGELTLSSETGNPNSFYIIHSIGFSIGNGILYQWQSNTDGQGWVDEGDALENYSLFRATAPEEIGTVVQWRLKVLCELSGQITFSDIVQFETQLVYCIPPFELGCVFGDFIDNFILIGENSTEINDTNTGCSPNGYNDSTNLSVDLNAGFDYTATISSGPYQTAAAVWIDFNKNGTFDSDELVGTVAGITNNNLDFNINIPSNVDLGETRMRVMLQSVQYPSDISPCDLFNDFGEAHDYTVNILEIPLCSGIPQAGEALAYPEVGMPNSLYTVSAKEYSKYRGISFQWQSNTNDIGWVDEGLPTDNYQDMEMVAPDEFGVTIRWRLMLMCNQSQETSTSEEAAFTVIEEDDGCIWTVSVFDDNFPGNDVTWELTDENNEVILSNYDGYPEFPYAETKIAAAKGPLTFHISANGSFSTPSFQISNGVEILIDDQLEGYSEQSFYDLNCENLSINSHKFIDFSYYPNPVDNILNLKANFDIDNIELYNLLGQKLLETSPNKKMSEVNLQGLQNGVYLMRVSINGISETIQVIKK